MTLVWVLLKHGRKRENTKAKILLAGFSQHYIRYAKKTSEQDLLVCD